MGSYIFIHQNWFLLKLTNIYCFYHKTIFDVNFCPISTLISGTKSFTMVDRRRANLHTASCICAITSIGQCTRNPKDSNENDNYQCEKLHSVERLKTLNSIWTLLFFYDVVSQAINLILTTFQFSFVFIFIFLAHLSNFI